MSSDPADDETPVDRMLQAANLGPYAELYPSLPGRLRKILTSDLPTLAARRAALLEQTTRRRDGRLRRLERDFRLTAAEARLALHIADGGDLAGYAEAQGVALGTARTHLKAVFAKTGVHRQAELVGRLAGWKRS
jgi:DNA-binding CsgD family transcriptional regulator